MLFFPRTLFLYYLNFFLVSVAHCYITCKTYISQSIDIHTYTHYKNNIKHSANYYNNFMFNLCMSLFFAETMLCYNFRFFFLSWILLLKQFFNSWSVDCRFMNICVHSRLYTGNHKNEATIYLMIILNDNATFLFYRTCFDGLKTSNFCRVSRWLILVHYLVCCCRFFFLSSNWRQNKKKAILLVQ